MTAQRDFRLGNSLSTYEGLEQKGKELEKEVDERKETEEVLRESDQEHPLW
jgi:hypothetical protein